MAVRTAMGALVVAVAVAVSSAATAATVRVVITDLEFTPSTITAKVGDVIEWLNTDFIAHTATARSGAFNVAVEANATATMPVTRAGIFAIYCKYHPNMTATVTVTP